MQTLYERSVVPALSANWPTATHTGADDVHETPRRLPLIAPRGAGMLWGVQLVPSQCSTSAIDTPAPSTKEPTATQLLELAHDTALRPPLVAPGGSGALCTAHRRNSSSIASGTCAPALSGE